MESENEVRMLYGYAEMLFRTDNPSLQFSTYASGGHCFDRYWKLARATVAYIQDYLKPPIPLGGQHFIPGYFHDRIMAGDIPSQPDTND